MKTSLSIDTWINRIDSVENISRTSNNFLRFLKGIGWHYTYNNIANRSTFANMQLGVGTMLCFISHELSHSVPERWKYKGLYFPAPRKGPFEKGHLFFSGAEKWWNVYQIDYSRWRKKKKILNHRELSSSHFFQLRIASFFRRLILSISSEIFVSKYHAKKSCINENKFTQYLKAYK